MKQTTKRIISMLLTVLMLVSMLSVYASATNNYVPDEEYYEKIVRDAFIVNPSWKNLKLGDSIEYIFRNELYGSTQNVIDRYTDKDEYDAHYETFDPTIHFTSFETAFNFCKENNIINPVIILCPGVYSEKITIDRDVTVMGANAGFDPNVVSGDASPWSINPEMLSYTSLAGQIDVFKYMSSDLEVVFDGIKFIDGFVYYEAGATEFASSLVIRNSVFDNMSTPVIDRNELSSILYFEKATTKEVSVTFDKVRIENLSATLIGNYVSTLNISNVFYGNSSAALLNGIEALAGKNPEYIIKDSMFYNNVTEEGALVFNHGLKDSTTRTKTTLEISGCYFVDGPDNLANADNAALPVITYSVVGPKNNVNIHDNTFVSSTEHVSAPTAFKFSSNAITNALMDSIYFNSNVVIGYPTIVDTTGLLKQSKLDLTGNYYADAEGNQVDPIYPSSSSYNNIIMDYFWIDSEKTVPSTIYYITSIGKDGFELKNEFKSLYVELDKNEKFTLKIKTSDSSTKYTVYSDSALTTEVTELDSANLAAGANKNIFYAVGTSTKAPEYKFIYKMYVSTYNPDYAPEFSEYNTYMYSPDVKDLAKGTTVCKDWDGTSYKFTVGKTIFATTQEIFDIADIPTILVPAGTYTENFCISESAIILGAKHGVNPNIPDFENFEKGWLSNPERSELANETVFENCAVYIATPSIDVTAEIDGITLGEGSSFFDIGDKVETHTTTTLKNILINNAGGAELKETDINGAAVTRTSGNIFNFGGTSKDFSNNHKDVRLINVRMENQSTYYLIGTYMESLYIDGLYFAGSSNRIHKSELTSPQTQNFTLEVRNSCFYQCTPKTGIIVVTNKETDTAEREFNKIIYDHNIFYQPSTYAYGVIGVRFYSSRDSFYFTNNIIMSTYAAHSLMPGNTGWFTGATACESLTVEQQNESSETVTDVNISFNRICGPYKPVDKNNVKYDTCWDYSYNYVCDLDDADNATGNFAGGVFKRTTPGIQMQKYSETQKDYMKCTTYFADWDMTELVNAPDSFKAELDYDIYPSTSTAKVDSTAYTYTDTVKSDVTTYTFNVKLNTQQATYGIYSDIDCLNEVSETVVLDKNINEFYIKFASYKNTVTHTYKVTITKELSSEAEIISIDNFSVSDNEVTAIVPFGTTSILLKNINLSNGATYKIYNDAAKTKRFYVTKIDNISETPIYKYIEVTSEDGSTVKDYVFSIKQGTSNLADVTNIQNATKLDDSTFIAYIPVNDSSFTLIPTFSQGATLVVTNEGLDHEIEANVPYLVHNIGNRKELTLKVTAQSGKTNTFKLIITKDPSNLDISYIYNMYNHGDDTSEFFTTVNTSSFKIMPTFKNTNTTYKFYKDEACTTVFENAPDIYLETKTTIVYLKATASDLSAEKIYKLTIVTTDPNAKPDLPSGGDDDGDGVVDDITKVFTDVVKGSWYEEYVTYVYNHGLFDGTSATTFSPQANMTRAQFVRILANFAGAETDNTIKSNFTDVPSDKWYTGAVDWAYKAGIVSGVGDNKFAPEKQITREEMAVMITNFAERYLKITLPETEEKVTFADDDSISSWAKDSVYKCQRAGLISGMGNNTYAPKNFATRAQGATIFAEGHKLIAQAQ